MKTIKSFLDRNFRTKKPFLTRKEMTAPVLGLCVWFNPTLCTYATGLLQRPGQEMSLRDLAELQQGALPGLSPGAQATVPQRP